MGLKKYVSVIAAAMLVCTWDRAGAAVTPITESAAQTGVEQSSIVSVVNSAQVTNGGTEIFAVKLSNANGLISPTDTAALTAIVQDINGANGFAASKDLSASLVSKSYATEFPGYDLLLTSKDGYLGNASALKFDFSSLDKRSTADRGIGVSYVTDVGQEAVPEPTGILAASLGLTMFALRRRGRKIKFISAIRGLANAANLDL